VRQRSIKQNPHIINKFRLIGVFWALITAKCYLLEFWVIRYNIPVNSDLFVWALPGGMALFATTAFVSRLQKEYAPKTLLCTPAFKIWLGVWAIGVILALLKTLNLKWGIEPIERSVSALICLAYFYHGVASQSLYRILLGFCWLIAVGIIAASPSIDANIFFSASLFILLTIPELIKYWSIRYPSLIRPQKQAEKILDR